MKSPKASASRSIGWEGRAIGKRSNFPRIERDCYDTPIEAVKPLIPHLPKKFTYVEPCAGAGALFMALDAFHGQIEASCAAMSDIEPRAVGIERADALDLRVDRGVDFIITNPPWDRKILHPMIEHFSLTRPTWLLFDADWMHTLQSMSFIRHCHKIVSVGRVKWIPGSKMTGKDNCAWYLFDQCAFGPCEFVGRDG